MKTESADARRNVTFSPEPRRKAELQRGNTLLKWLKEFQPKEADIACRLLAKDACGNRRSFAGNDSRRSRGGSGDGEMNNLIWAQEVAGGDAGTSGADIESLRQLDEFRARGIGRAKEYRHLQTNTRRAPCVRFGHAPTSLQEASVHDVSFSTLDLVRE